MIRCVAKENTSCTCHMLDPYHLISSRLYTDLPTSYHVRLVPLGHIVFPFCISILFVLGFPPFLSFLFSIHDVLQLLQIHVDVCTQYCEARLNSTTVARKPYINLLNQKTCASAEGSGSRDMEPWLDGTLGLAKSACMHYSALKSSWHFPDNVCQT